MKIFYYSATGNSLKVAKSIGDEVYSIPSLLKDENESYTDDVIGFVFPCYYGSIPTIIEDFIRDNQFEASYTFAIVTYGNFILGTEIHFEKFAKKHGLRIDYLNKLKMIDSALTFCETQKQIETAGKKQIEEHLKVIVDDIHRQVKSPTSGSYLMSKISNVVAHSYRKGIGNCDKVLTVEEHCTLCGICAQVCPVDNITVTEAVQFHHKCIGCLACTHLCPCNAIRVKGEKSKVRFRNQDVSLEELIQANV